jgi:hypothetical protein
MPQTLKLTTPIKPHNDTPQELTFDVLKGRDVVQC